MRARMRPALALVLGTALVLAACAPQARPAGEPVVAIINGPAQHAVNGSAQAVHEHFAQDAERGFALVSPFSLRFLEAHSDLFDDRAAPSAARIARGQGADLAIMIGVPVQTRTVTLARDEASRRVDIEVALEAQVIDARNGAIVQTLRTRNHFGSRVEANDFPLPEPADDGTLMALVEDAAVQLTAALRAELPYLFSQLLLQPTSSAPTGSSGG